MFNFFEKHLKSRSDVGVIFVLFFSLGYNKKFAYVPALVLFLSFAIQKMVEKGRVFYSDSRRSLYVGFGYILLITVCHFSPYTTILSPTKNVLKINSVICLTLFIQTYWSKEVVRRVVSFFLAGIIFDLIIYVLYNMLFKEGAYAMIHDPYSDKIENSPRLANQLALCCSFLLPYLFSKATSRWIWSGSFIILVLFSYFGFYLKARSFIALVTLSLIILPFCFKKIINFKRVLIGELIVIVSFLFFLFSTEIGDNILSRIGNVGFKRLELFKDAFGKLFFYPFGGYSPSGEFSNSHWYHNYFLDIARLCGYGGLLLAIVLFLYSLVNLIKMYSKISTRDESMFIYIFILAFTLMQQDVIIEGNPILLLTFIMCSLFLIDKTKNLKS